MRIEPDRRLVEEQQFAPAREHARDGDALRLATLELRHRRAWLGERGIEPHAFQPVRGAELERGGFTPTRGPGLERGGFTPTPGPGLERGGFTPTRGPGIAARVS